MTIKRRLHLSAAAIALAAFLAASPVPLNAQQGAPPAVSVGATDLGGVVTGPSGPEAGVWVIAETTDLPTRYIKSVVTDDQGRYVIPDLPRANYEVWVRGYGLVDTAKVRSEPGKIVNFTATAAPNAKAAAEVYPSIYWYAMLKVPPKHEFPVGSVKTQSEWLNVVKTNGCFTCHALGNKATRTIPPEFGDMKSEDAWARRILSGQAMTNMATNIGRMHAPQAIKLFADWTDRIAAGELPAAQPRRPQGRERNVVITQWDFSEPQFYLHDVISTDKRKPTVNANGLVYGATEESTDFVPIVDPVNHRALQVKMPVRDPKTRSSKENARQPSPYWGNEVIWDSQASMHNPMMDEKGQVWFTSRVGPAANPDFCKKGSEHPSAKVFPVNESNRHLSMLDPKTDKITLIRTCYPTHHLVFAEDANNTLWMSAGGPQSGVLGWLDRKKFEETGDEQASQGWTPIVIDTNGNGKRDEWVEPNQPVDPAKDKRIVGALYGIGVNPQDGTIWGSVLTFPGYVIRVNPGPN
ncbi:MAG TPA: carboxypeptidase-like regulatory domain-containing protein, partial [Xanthobacteraceae bacterium]|nr:carboxypeptidase-like regulatory domain-containing protein [Xanthobacteraceae bacterium]